MLTEVIMPKLGLTMEEGAVQHWHKAVGAQVVQGEPLVDIETDKTVVEVEAPADGFLRQIIVAQGTSGVPVGTPLALITTGADEAIAAAAPAPTASTSAPASAATSVAASAPAGSEADAGAVRASPAARRRARELKVDLARITGTGPRGAVSVEDVEKAAASAAAAPAAPTGSAAVAPGKVPLNNMRRAIARAMVFSHRSAPVFVLRRKARADALLAAYRARKAELRASGGPDLTVTDLVLRAAAAALLRHPQVNASFVGEPDDADAHILVHPAVHLGLAVATDAGLVVPVIRDAGGLSLAQLAERRSGVVARARAGKLKADELSGGTFSVSNLGGMGVDSFDAVINPPEAAILAVGRTIEELVVDGGKMSIAQTIDLSLSCDHRVIDGAQGAAFLVDLVGLLEQPAA